MDPLLGEVTPAASNILGVLYFGCLYGLTGHLQVHHRMLRSARVPIPLFGSLGCRWLFSDGRQIRVSTQRCRRFPRVWPKLSCVCARCHHRSDEPHLHCNLHHAGVKARLRRDESEPKGSMQGWWAHFASQSFVDRNFCPVARDDHPPPLFLSLSLSPTPSLPLSLLKAIPEMFEWKRHFERERAAGMYSTGAYWLVSQKEKSRNFPRNVRAIITIRRPEHECPPPSGTPAVLKTLIGWTEDCSKSMDLFHSTFRDSRIGFGRCEFLMVVMETSLGIRAIPIVS